MVNFEMADCDVAIMIVARVRTFLIKVGEPEINIFPLIIVYTKSKGNFIIFFELQRTFNLGRLYV